VQDNDKYITTMKGQGYLASYDRIRKIKTWEMLDLISIHTLLRSVKISTLSRGYGLKNNHSFYGVIKF
jgi:hypothetical protein